MHKHITQEDVKDRLAACMGFSPAKLKPQEVFDAVLKGFILFDRSFMSFDRPLTERSKLSGDDVRAALKDMGLFGRQGVLKENFPAPLVASACKEILCNNNNIAEVISKFYPIWGGRVVAWKSFAFLLPDKVPLLDRLVVSLYVYTKDPKAPDFELAFKALMEDYNDEKLSWRSAMESLHESLGDNIKQRLTPLRIFDIILWTYAKHQ